MGRVFKNIRKIDTVLCIAWILAIISAFFVHPGKEYLGYIDFVDPRMKNQVIVLETNTKYTPRLTVYSLAKGNTLDLKMKKPLFNKYKIVEGTTLKIKKSERKPKYKKTENGFEIVSGEFDWWIRDCEVIK